MLKCLETKDVSETYYFNDEFYSIIGNVDDILEPLSFSPIDRFQLKQNILIIQIKQRIIILRRQGKAFSFLKHFTLDSPIDYFKLMKFSQNHHVLTIITKKQHLTIYELDFDSGP